MTITVGEFRDIDPEHVKGEGAIQYSHTADVWIGSGEHRKHVGALRQRRWSEMKDFSSRSMSM